MIADSPVVDFFRPRLRQSAEYGPYDCRIMDARANTKCIITGKSQIREDLLRLQKRLKSLMERE